MDDEAKLWRAYKKSPTTANRNAIAERYLKSVSIIARITSERTRGKAEYDDLNSVGFLGLCQAIESFDPSRGVQFISYATRRIRGAMLDYLRIDCDEVPRLSRRRSNQIEAARQMFVAQTGRQPSDDELRVRMGVTKAEYRKMVDGHSDAVSHDSSVSIANMMQHHERDHGVDTISDGQERQITRAERDDLRRRVTRKLDSRQRAVMVMYYYEGMNQPEIGAALGVCDSRVSQLRREVLEILRADPSLQRELEQALT